MLLRLIDDINKALKCDALFSALALALTLPDICGKAQYPEEGTKKRFIAWYNEHVGVTEKCPDPQTEMPYLSGEVVYSLRCCYLHQGTPNIERDKIREDSCKIDHFSLLFEKKNEFNIYGDTATVSCGVPFSTNGEKRISYQVSIRRLCLILTACAKGYYEQNKEKFDFFKFTVTDEGTSNNDD